MTHHDDQRTSEKPTAYAPGPSEGPTWAAAPGPDEASVKPTADTEADILRAELEHARERASALEEDLAEANNRALRTRAEMETMRRRLLAEVELARTQGRDEALMPVLAVYDDLERALTAATESGEPGSIVTGVQLVKDNLERALEGLGVRRVGYVGERFDPEYHEALTTVRAGPGRLPGTIAQVFVPGFVQGERLVRVARVVVVEHEGD